MELRLSTFLILCPLVFLAGLVDSVSGGGGLISLSAYLLAGAPAHTALATNKLSSVAGAAVASFRYYRNGFVDLVLCLPGAAASLAGSALGSYLTLQLDEKYLQRLLLAVLPFIAFYVLRKKKLESIRRPLSFRQTMLIVLLISFVLGAYDGFFGPGTGVFLILLYTGLAGMEARTAGGNAKVVNLASNAAALAVFLYHGQAAIPLGLCAAAFSILGAYIGSGLVIRRGALVMRYSILAVLALLFIKTAWDFLHSL